MTWDMAERLCARLPQTPVFTPPHGTGGQEDEPLQVVLDRITHMTHNWKDGSGRQAGHVIAMNTAGTRPPLFWCLQDAHESVALAEYLGPQQPLYVMRSGHLVMNKSERQERKLGRYYAGEIMRVRPEGAVQIGGNCQGARIAYEIALALLEAGRRVTVLCMMEMLVERPYPGRVALFYGEHSYTHNLYFTRLMPECIWRRHYADFTVDIIPGRHGQFFIEPNVQGLAAKLRSRLAEHAPV